MIFRKADKSDLQGSRASRHVSVSAGLVTFEDTPSLEVEARELLQSNPAQFQDRFGDYFVTGLQVGASAGCCLTASQTTESKESTTKISVTVHAFLWDATTESSETHQSSSSTYNLDFSGYNTLLEHFGSKQCSSGSPPGPVLNLASAYMTQVTDLQHAFAHEMKAHELVTGARVSRSSCSAACKAGLVSHLILRPYRQLPEVVASTPIRILA